MAEILSPGVREDRANRWVIVAFGLIGLLAAYLPAYTDKKGVLDPRRLIEHIDDSLRRPQPIGTSRP